LADRDAELAALRIERTPDERNRLIDCSRESPLVR
jgi:hypothetical protein